KMTCPVGLNTEINKRRAHVRDEARAACRSRTAALIIRFDVSHFPKVDQPFAGDDYYRRGIDRDGADGWWLVLSDAEVLESGLSTRPAGLFFARDSCGSIGSGLPLLP